MQTQNRCGGRVSWLISSSVVVGGYVQRYHPVLQLRVHARLDVVKTVRLSQR